MPRVEKSLKRDRETEGEGRGSSRKHFNQSQYHQDEDEDQDQRSSNPKREHDMALNVSVVIGRVRQASHNNAPTTHNDPITPDNPVSALLDLFEIPSISKHRRPRDDYTPPRVAPVLSLLSPCRAKAKSTH